jgi:hypothetical protein
MDNYTDVRLSPLLIISESKWCSDISTNEQKKEWFLRLNPNGTKLLTVLKE